MKTNKIITIIALLICFTTSYAQKYTDKEIGFDRSELAKEYKSEGIQNSELDKFLVSLREEYVINFERRAANQSRVPVQPQNTGCTNMDFSQNTNAWTFNWSKGTYGTRPLEDLAANGAYGSPILTTIDDADGEHRFQILPANTFDVNLGTNIIPGAPASTEVILLGRREEVPPPNESADVGQEQLSKSFTLSDANAIFEYSYAIVFEEPGHGGPNSFEFYIEVNGQPISENCSGLFYTTQTATGANGFIDSANDPDDKVKPWSTNIVDLSSLPGVNNGDEITVSFINSDCALGAHGSYAFISTRCLPKGDAIQIENTTGDTNLCKDDAISFETTVEVFPTDELLWEILYGGTVIYSETGSETLIYTFPYEGDYSVRFTVIRDGCPLSYTEDFTILNCDESCDCNSFAPEPGKYIISAWVKEVHAEQQLTYLNSFLQLNFISESPVDALPPKFYPEGAIIDGWQRIAAEFTIPTGTTDLQLMLVNENTDIVAYFDDIRVHPFNSNMKSFVYDQATQRLMAELDENNYATFYEYDQEGGLIRVKKETVQGTYTIQETRSGNSTLNNDN